MDKNKKLTLVAHGPGVPLQGDLSTGLGLDESTAVGGLLVAGNVGGTKGIGAHEAVVQVVGAPANGLGNGVLVAEGSVPALVRLAVSDDGFDVAVGGDEGGDDGGNEERAHGDFCFLV